MSNLLLFSGGSGRARRLTRSLISRALANNGTVIDPNAIEGLYGVLYKVGLLSSLRRGYSDLAAVRINDVAGTLFVQERFDLNDGTLGGASSSVNAIQSNAANQAGWTVDADTGRRQTTYDGSNDLHNVADLSVFRNQSAGFVFAIVKDTNRTGGDVSHAVCAITTAGGGGRVFLRTRDASSNVFSIAARRTDADASTVSATAASVDGYSALAGLMVWGGNILQGNFNGTATSTANYLTGGGSTSDTDSTYFRIGADSTTGQRVTGPISEILFFRTAPSTAQLNALRNFYRRYYPTLP